MNLSENRLSSRSLAFPRHRLCRTRAGRPIRQIAGIVVTADQIDIDAGKLAKSPHQEQGSLEFAQQMITDHARSTSRRGAREEARVSPRDSPTSQSLKAGAAENTKNLKGLKGAAFDKAYVDHEWRITSRS